MNAKGKFKKIFLSCLSFIVIGIMIIPFIQINGESYTLIRLWKFLSTDEFTKYLVSQDPYIKEIGFIQLTVRIQLIVLIILSALGFIKGILTLLDKKIHSIFWYVYFVLCMAILFLNFSGVGLLELSWEGGTLIFLLIPLITGVLHWGIEALLREIQTNPNLNSDKKQTEEKKEKTEVFRSRNLRSIFIKIYKNIWKNTLLYHIFSGIGIGGVIAMLSIRLSIGNKVVSENTINAMSGILKDALLPFLVVFGFVMVILLVYYFEKNMDTLNMFYILGMKKADQNAFLIGLFGAAYIGSLIIGSAFGFVFLKIAKAILSYICQMNLDFSLNKIAVAIVAALWGVFFLFIIGISHDRFATRNYMDSSREWVPKRFLKAGMILSVVITLALLWIYHNGRHFENKMWLLCVLLCVFLFLRCFVAESVKYRSVLERKKKVLSKNQVRWHSRTTTIFAAIVSLLFIYLIFVVNIQMSTARVQEELEAFYPYDLVAYAYEEDAEIYKNMAEKYQLHMKTFPMVRVSNFDMTDQIESRGVTPAQGQQIGISESTYHSLKAMKDESYEKTALDLDEEQIYIVHQQDSSVRAQPIDYWLWSRRPLLHIGEPCLISYWEGIDAGRSDISYDFRKITGEEICSLTGILDCTGKQENIIVFSDQYFEEAKNFWKTTNYMTGYPITEEDLEYASVLTRQGPNQLVLMSGMKAEDLNHIKEDLKEVDKIHANDKKYSKSVKDYYLKNDTLSDLWQSRVMKYSVGAVEMILFSFLILMMIIVEIVTTEEELCTRDELLRYLGLRREKRFQLMRNDLLGTIHIGEIFAILVSIGLIGATMYARMFTVDTVKANLHFIIRTGICALLINELLMQVIVSLWLWKSEGRK